MSRRFAAFLQPIFAVLAIAVSASAPAQMVPPSNSFAAAIQNNAVMQANLTRQMINMGGTSSSGGGVQNPATCMPPVDLQRGVNGQVPPQLQGDPRYQEYLQCKQGAAGGSQGANRTAASPAMQGGQHLPLTATDFVPAGPGHPVVDQTIGSMALTDEQRVQLRQGVETLFDRVAKRYRRNNLAVSVMVAYSTAMLALNGTEMNADQTRDFVFAVNDRLGQAPQFERMSPLERQTNSDSLIFQSAMISILRDMGASDRQARQQSIELARVVLARLNGS